MRVAIDTNGLFTGQAGGARHIRGFLHGLELIRPQLESFHLAWEVENLQFKQPQRMLKTFYRELVWAKTVAPRELRRRKADLYHATGSYFVSCPSSVQPVVTLYDMAVIRHPERFRRWHRWSESKRLQRLKSVPKVLCISRFTADEAISLLGLNARQIEVVYCGCDFHPSEPARPEEKPTFEVPSDFFLFVGSLEPGKNLVLLRRVYELAEQKGIVLPPLLVMGVRWAGVAGEGKPPAGWHYLGRQSDGVLQYLYRRATAFVFPSKYEGFGLPVAEAMALGCPVICSRVASLPEVGGDAALYPEMTPESYLEALVAISKERGLREGMIEKGLRQAQRFSWAECARQTVDIYRQVYEHA